jgi:hypothetical protein
MPAAAGVWVTDWGRSATLALGDAVVRGGSAVVGDVSGAGFGDGDAGSTGALLGAGVSVDVGVVGLAGVGLVGVDDVVDVGVVVVVGVVMVVVGVGVRRWTSVRGAQV